jgi:hypothetical protein
VAIHKGGKSLTEWGRSQVTKNNTKKIFLLEQIMQMEPNLAILDLNDNVKKRAKIYVFPSCIYGFCFKFKKFRRRQTVERMKRQLEESERRRKSPTLWDRLTFFSPNWLLIGGLLGAVVSVYVFYCIKQLSSSLPPKSD